MNKQELLDAAPASLRFLQAAIVVYASTSMMLRRKSDFLIATGLCVFDLVIGFRASTTFFILIAIAYWGYRWEESRRGCIAKALLPVIFLLLYLAAALASGLMRAVRSVLLGEEMAPIDTREWLISQIQYTEAFSQQAILERVLSSPVDLPWYYSLDLLRLALPFVNSIFGKPLDFNAIFQPILFPEIRWGMASNLWAEQLCVGGIVWMYLFAVLVFVVVSFVNKSIRALIAEGAPQTASVLLIVFVPSLAFMHRNCLGFQLQLIRDSLFVIAAAWVLGAASMRSTRRASASSIDLPP
jgi:hypothetical protein